MQSRVEMSLSKLDHHPLSLCTSFTQLFTLACAFSKIFTSTLLKILGSKHAHSTLPVELARGSKEPLSSSHETEVFISLKYTQTIAYSRHSHLACCQGCS